MPLTHRIGPDPRGHPGCHRHCLRCGQGPLPVGMDPDALLNALERLCREVRRRHGRVCRLQGDREVVIRKPETHCYCIRSPARRSPMPSSMRSASTSPLRSTLGWRAGDADRRRWSGTGGGSGTRDGDGLSIMRYRAGLLGGTLQVGAGQTGGLEVTCRAPGLENT
jgi:hypothetical protein